MISREFAVSFARHWIDAWNSHDLKQVLSHYSEDFEMSSAYIVQMTGELSGTLKGKPAVGQYWAKALERMPDLRFELIDVLVGIGSITLYYRGVSGMAAEVFFFNGEDKVIRAYAHYV